MILQFVLSDLLNLMNELPNGFIKLYLTKIDNSWKEHYNDYSNMTIGVIMRKSASRIAAGELKAKCLKIMDQVKETHIPVIITKHGTPMAESVIFMVVGN